MRNFVIVGLLIGLALVLLGYFARSPGQTALSSAVIAAGIAAILIVTLVALLFRFRGRTIDDSGNGQ